MSNVESQMTNPDLDAIKAEIARLDAEARQRQEAVREMIRAEVGQLAIVRVGPDQDEPGPLDLVRIEREKTAFLLVDRADEIGSRAQATATAEYRRVLEHFPDTQAAHVAEERLKTL
jgi:antitoxin component HigA of HigAB toxin-antitoxin module